MALVGPVKKKTKKQPNKFREQTTRVQKFTHPHECAHTRKLLPSNVIELIYKGAHCNLI